MNDIFSLIDYSVNKPADYTQEMKNRIESQINIYMANFISNLSQEEYEKIKKDKIIVPTNG
jgi:hypothetical protein